MKEVRKVFFFVKKEAKNFHFLRLIIIAKQPYKLEVFWFFFFK
jgi:hypothetical protein